MSPEFLAVQSALGHSFSRPELLQRALTHRSWANEHLTEGEEDNERLEFLGDAVLGLVAAQVLFERHPRASEGELTRRRASIVNEASLAETSRRVGIGEALRLGRGEARTGGRDKPRLLASALEACLAAVYLDAGLDAAVRCGHTLFADRLDDAAPDAWDFKTRLQEMVQAEEGCKPRYEVLATTGPEHQREYHVALRIGEAIVAEGRGRSKSEAEREAARIGLELRAGVAREGAAS